MSEDALKAKAPGLLCTSLAGEPGKRQCSWPSFLGGGPLIAELQTYADSRATHWLFEFYDDKLGFASVTVDAPFDDVVNALRQKYGEAKLNPQGVRSAEWQGRNGELIAFSTLRGETSIAIRAPWYDERAKQNAQALGAKKAKDL